MRLDFVVPGFSNCGTTTLCSLLSEHPAIFMPEEKDFRLFDLPDPERCWDTFAARFAAAPPSAVRGDGSAWYTEARYERVARQRILARYPNIRLIFIARDPIARIESSFREFHHSGSESGVGCPFELEAALDAVPGLLDDSMYNARLSNYLDHVPSDRVLIVFLEELVARPERELARCFSFLDVDPEIVIAGAGTARLNTGSEKCYDTDQLRQLRAEPATAAALSRIPKALQAKLLPALGLRERFTGGPLPWSTGALQRVTDRIGEDVCRFLEHCGKPPEIWPRFAEAVSGRRVSPARPASAPGEGGMQMTAGHAPFDEVRTEPPRQHDPLLDLFHNTRHASPRHGLIRGRTSWQLASPWLSRFDWILDAPLALSANPGRLCLTKQRAVPQTVFVKTGHVEVFMDHVLPRIWYPVLLYIGNGDLPLSRSGAKLNDLLDHPLIHRVFCENKDLDVDEITALPIGLHPADMLVDDSVLDLRALSSEVRLEAKEERVFGSWDSAGRAIDGGHDRAAALRFLRENPAVGDFAEPGTVAKHRRRLSRYRFALIPFGSSYDSPATFEALILKTIPILRAGPHAEAYRGLPVVTVDAWEEIVPERLAQWWRELSPKFADMSFVTPGFWWQRLQRHLPPQQFEIRDGNRKWYRGEATSGSPPSSRGVDCGDGFAEDLTIFRDRWFPCDASHRDEFERRVTAGKRRMRSSRAVFCAIARDVDDSLPSVIARIERAGAMFADYRVVVYENDSRDNTAERLRQWGSRNPRVHVDSEILGVGVSRRDRSPERMRHLAACRNRYLDHTLEHHSGFDYLIVFDSDLPRGFSYTGLASTFGQDDWDMVGSNGLLVPPRGRPLPRPMFFDAWAFRAVGENEPRSFDEVNRLLFGRGEPLVPVWSCFGGLGVYRMEALRGGARYGGGDCEHVVLHQQMREQGFDRLFLNPSQIVLYSEEGVCG